LRRQCLGVQNSSYDLEGRQKQFHWYQINFLILLL
jgi:hypothetical protein